LRLYKKIPYATKSATSQILHNLENLYIESVIKGDREGTKATLKGMIRCRHLLGRDASTYEEEYTLLVKSDKVLKRHIEKKDSKKVVQDKKIILTNISVKDSEIVLIFNKEINDRDVIFFELNSKSQQKDIYDIKATFDNSVDNSIDIKGLDRSVISQNSKDKIRLVLQDSSKVESSAYIKGKKLIIDIKKEKRFFVKNKSRYQKVKRYTKTIVIDPGHGGKDSGAIGCCKYKEKDIVLGISKRVKKILKSRGFRVYMTRDKNIFIDLKDRTHFANIKNADLFISIHANSITNKKHNGIETYYLSPAKSERAKRAAEKENRASLINMDKISKNTLLSFLNRQKIIQSNKLALDIHGGVLESLKRKYRGVNDSGVKPAPFWVLVGAQMPAILLETGYLTNHKEAKRLKNGHYQSLIAKGIANGIESYFLRN
jgi:N-acetylmuramoyl-L-alanine amidase